MICPLKQEKIEFDAKYTSSIGGHDFEFEYSHNDEIYVLYYEVLNEDYWYFPEVKELNGEYCKLLGIDMYVNGELEELSLNEFSVETLEKFIEECDKDAEWQIGNWGQ